MSIKNSSDTTGNRTHCLPACIAVIPPAAPLRSPPDYTSTLTHLYILTNHLVMFSSPFFVTLPSHCSLHASLPSTLFPYNYSAILKYQVHRTTSQCRRITVAVFGQDTMKTTSTIRIKVLWDNDCQDTCLHIDYTMGSMIQGFIHSRSKSSCSSPTCPDLLWGP